MWPRVGVGVTVAGVDSTTTQHWQPKANEDFRRQNLINWWNCGWSETRQQHSTKRSERWIYMTSKPTKIHLKLGKTVAGVQLNNNTARRKQSERWYYRRQNLSNFRNKHTKTRITLRQNSENCGWSETTTTTQQARKPERKQQGRKIRWPSWNVCSKYARLWRVDVDEALGCVYNFKRRDYQL
jgi:hypothetical protein